jgi:sRNA-binding carbon storage regulator CsrA
MIDDQRIQVLLNEAKNGKASISIDAPEEILILREELE